MEGFHDGTQHSKLKTIRLQIILDFTSLMDETVSNKCMEALQNMLVLARFTQLHRILQVGVSSINHTVHHALKATSLAHKFSTVCSSLKRILTKPKLITGGLPLCHFKDCLAMAIQDTCSQQNAVDSATTANGVTDNRIIFTLVSCRDGQSVLNLLREFHNGLTREVECFQVVQLSTTAAQPSLSECGGLRTAGAALKGGPIFRLAVVPTAAGAVGAALEAALRVAWFTPSELRSLELHLGPSRGSSRNVLRCTTADCVLDPAGLPVADYFSLTAATSASGGGGGCGGGGGGRHLRVVARLNAEGLCEGSLFGVPLRVTWAPRAAFQWSAARIAEHGLDFDGLLEDPEDGLDGYRQNAHMFLALCDMLIESDEYLVAKMQAGTASEEAGGHFILMPGDQCLLLRAVASAEMVLPAAPPPALQYDAVEAVQAKREVCALLDRLAVEDQYQSKRYRSGLCRALQLTAEFPQRLCLPRQARPEVPPEVPAEVPEAPMEVVQVLSSDEEVPEVSRQPRRKRPSVEPHRLGTGGHPALEHGFSAPKQRRKNPPPSLGIFMSRRT